MNTHESALQRALDEYSHLDLTHDIVAEGSRQIGGGGFSDVFCSKMRPGWRARTDPQIERLLVETHSVGTSHQSDPDCVMIAVKRLRFWGDRDPKAEKAIAKELKIWIGLSHSNVLPLLGYVYNWTGTIYPSFVSPWIKNGTLRNYMKKHNVDVPVMTSGIISGLQYLHSQRVVHADLKCDNVLLSVTLQPLLTDFGLSRQIIASVSTSTTISRGTLRWKAPELMGEGERKANEQSDIWALGMTILELLTKDIPYNGMSEVQVVRSLVDRSLPPVPDDLTQRPLLDQRLWSLCQDCWVIDPSIRPTAIEVQNRVYQILPPESTARFTQGSDIFTRLDLTHIAKPSASVSGTVYSIPSSHFNSPAYRENRGNIYFQRLLEICNSEGAPEECSEVEVQFAVPSLRSSQIKPKSSVIAKEMATLIGLSHPNVLPFLGYYLGSEDMFTFVFPKTNETLDDYITRKAVDILPMAEGIASGLAYLHSNDVVCSILTSYILVTPTLRPVIAVSNFLLSQPDIGVPQGEYQERFQNCCRWMAVEIFDDRRAGYTSKETDVWAFGMTILELFTKQLPYGVFISDDSVIENLKHHRLPPPPYDIVIRSKGEKELWPLVQECWNFEPSERPTAQHIHERIQGIVRDFPSETDLGFNLQTNTGSPSMF